MGAGTPPAEGRDALILTRSHIGLSGKNYRFVVHLGALPACFFHRTPLNQLQYYRASQDQPLKSRLIALAQDRRNTRSENIIFVLKQENIKR